MFPLKNEGVRAALQSYPRHIREKLMEFREIILTTASETVGVGEIEETLKWGEPAYLTSQSGSGSTIRLAWKRSTPTQYRMLFNCQTNLVDTFRTIHPNFTYDGNRAILFELGDDPPEDAVAHCVEIALSYHLTKRARQAMERTKA